MGFSNLAVSISSLLSSGFYIFVAVLVLLVMITIHELGHYTAGKILGFKINEFAIGFGKKIYSKKNKDGEEFSLRAIPLGGYCAFEGEDEDSKNPDAFNNQKPWKRLIVLFSGALFNFVSAIFFAIILLTAYGYDIPEITSVETSGPNVGILQVDDVIWAVEGEKINFINDNLLFNLLGKYEVGKTITLDVERDGSRIDLDVELYELVDGENTYKIIGISVKAHPFSFFTAVARSIPFTFGMAWKILAFLIMLLTGQQALEGIGGPITTISTIATFTQTSFAGFLVLLPLIAANLAVFNLLPIPALDGSRMVFVVIEWLRGKPINPKIEGYIHGIGLLVLLSLVLLLDLFNLLT